MPFAIILGILFPGAHGLSILSPYLIGIMMVLTFVSKVPPQQHGATFKIECRSFLMSLVLIGILTGLAHLFNWSKEFLLAGVILCLAPPANAAPAMCRILGGNPVLALKIFVSGHLIACFSIPLIIGIYTGQGDHFFDISRRIFNSIQPIITIPLAVALGLRSYYPELADRVARFQKYTLLVWTFAVFIVLSKASYNIRMMGVSKLWESGELPQIALFSFVLCVLLFALGWFSGRKKYPVESSQSMGQKNTVLVIWIAEMYIGPVAALGPVCYVVWQNMVLTWMSRKKTPAVNPGTPLPDAR